MPHKRDQTDANRRYYWDHRAEEIERVQRRQAKTLAFLATLKSRPCSDCASNSSRIKWTSIIAIHRRSPSG
jgi:hypothetical protein